MRLVDLHEAKKKAVNVTQYDEGGWDISFKAVSLEELQRLPTIEVEPVVHGRWLQPKPGECFCSECKTLGSPHWKRCPVCEAKMSGGDAG